MFDSKGDVFSIKKLVDDDVDEEEEPQLKYHRLEADVTNILRSDEASCFCVAEKMLSLGTHSGAVYLLTCLGDKVQHFESHKAAVQDVCFDEQVETLGSCSDDGTIVVRSLISDECYTIQLQRPLKTLALDPLFSSKTTHEVVSGGVSGRLMMSSQGWFGNRNVVIHSGQGPIHNVKWSGNLVTWANDHSVRVYDVALQKALGLIEKPESASPSSECYLYWHPDRTLYIGWSSTVIIASLPTNEAAAGAGQEAIRIIKVFEIQGIIAGVAPFGYHLALLIYMKEQNSQEEANSETATPLRPEIRIVTKSNAEISSDSLSITGYEHLEANDYKLFPCYPTSCLKSSFEKTQLGAPSIEVTNYNNEDTNCGRSLVQWWREGEEPLYYVVTPNTIIVGMPQDQVDRVHWLLEHHRFGKALSIASVIRQKEPEMWNTAVDRYIEHLIKENKIEEAAQRCPEFLGNDLFRWDRYIYIFAQANHLGTLASYVPIENLTLKTSSYMMILKSCIVQPVYHLRLQELVDKWPPSLYSPSSLSKEIYNKLHSIRGDQTILMEVLAKLYILQNLHENAMEVYLQLQRPEVFDYIIQHALLRFLTNRISRLISLDQDRALELLCNHTENVDPEEVIQEVTGAMKEAPNDAKKNNFWRTWLYKYMDTVVSANIAAAPTYHHLLVELYADYKKEKLMDFLKKSHQYPLDQAYEICRERGLINEMVHILSRMGNTHEALQLIIKNLADIPRAIEFARNQNDDDLWDSLIDWAVGDAATTGDLLDQVGGHVDPLRVISRIPKGMEIGNLRQRLRQVITDYRTQTTLQEGCSGILKSDCVHLSGKLYSEVRHCVRDVYITSSMTVSSEEKSSWTLYSTVFDHKLPTNEPEVDSMRNVGHQKQSTRDEYGMGSRDMESDLMYSDRRSSLKFGFLSEDSPANVEYTDSLRFKLVRGQAFAEEDQDQLSSLIQ